MWTSWRGTVGFIATKVRAGQFNGQQPVGLHRSDWDDAMHCALVLGPVGRSPWKEYLALTATDLRQRVEEGRHTGWRPEVLSPYPMAAGGIGFTAVFLNDGDRVGWAFEMDLTPEEYERTLAANKAKGLRPAAVAPYDSGRETRYAAVWVTYRPVPEPTRPKD